MPEVNNVQRFLSPQETFNIGRKHLLTQGKKSQGFYPEGASIINHDGGDRCLYRSPQPDGTVLQCGAGPFIKDEFYRPSFEGRAISGLITDHPEAFGEVLPDRGVAFRLQSIHDNLSVESWVSGLSALAIEQGLDLEPLDLPPVPPVVVPL